MLDAGHLLDNRYRLDERIATGGMGDVWRGTDVVLGRVVAVKVLRAAMMTDPEFAARFYGEARMMAAFRHPGVVEVYDYAGADDSLDDDQCAYLVMAYVEGEPLSARLKEAGRLGVAETMSIVAQAADALHAAHRNGTVHRDVKPGNLIVKPTGAVILVDFGVARSGGGDQRDRAQRDRRHRPLHGPRAGRQGQRHAGHGHLRAGRGGVPLHLRAARRSTGTTPCRWRCGTSTRSRTRCPTTCRWRSAS